MNYITTIENVKELLGKARHTSESPYLVRNFIDEALALLEAEEPSEDVEALRSISCKIIDLNPVEDDIEKIDAIVIQFARSSHLVECAKCKALPNVEQ